MIEQHYFNFNIRSIQINLITNNSNRPFNLFILQLFSIINQLQKMSPTVPSPPTNIDILFSNQQTASSNPQKQCRICLQENLPMIIACSCTGTVKYVHEQCLKHWAIEVIKKKIKEQEDEGYEDTIESIECELCKQNIQLKVEWTDKKLTFQEARLRNQEYFCSMLGINVFIILVCLGCIVFTLVTMIMVLVKNPKVDYQKFLEEPLLSWGTLSVALVSGLIFIVKAIKDLYSMFVRRQFQIEGVIAKQRIGEEHSSMSQGLEIKMNNVRSTSDFRINAQGMESDLNKGLSTRSKKISPTLQIEPETNQEIIVPSGSIASLRQMGRLPPLSKFVPNS